MSPTTFAALDARTQFRTFVAMERHGGGFCSALAQAWFRADASNKRRIEGAFAHLLTEYGPDSRYFTA
jgi:hypothetical protein